MQGNDTPPVVLRTVNGSIAVERICETCGSRFLAPRTRVAKGYGRFCSGPCYGKAKERKSARACATCGAAFERKLSETGPYCSPECYRLSQYGERSSLADRFWSKVDKDSPCWLWTASRQKRSGYGTIRAGGVVDLAHRVAFTLASGEPIPDEHIIGHTCDVTNCVRNDEQGVYAVEGVEYPRWGHLFCAPGQLANILDMWQKGRGVGGHRPDPATRLLIVQRYATGDISQAALAGEYGVDQTTVSRMILQAGLGK